MQKEIYTKEDKNCTHCGGNLSLHEGGIIWCDDCGSNNPTIPPMLNMEFVK